TLVLFTSEQGSQFPGCKWTNWNTGVHTALIAAWPGQISENTRTSALVQYADVAPTLLDLAGATNPPEVLDGSSFAPVLRGEADVHRSFAYGLHHNLPEGPSYPIRSITDGTYRYIQNLLPEEIYIEKHLMGGGRLNNPYWATWVGADPLKNPNAYQLVKRYQARPAEELYASLDDPYEQTNLAGHPEYRETLENLRTAMQDWMTAEGDPGAKVDTPEALKAARQGKHLY
ncbi:MAG: sulfatase/phosphatase domain-containing protein, partial [Verrucomicrobiota bacterium]